MKKIRFLSFLLVFVLVACGASGWKEHYNLGMKYLNEGKYEEAILEFDKAIEIDDKQAIIYAGRGQAYISRAETNENFDLALADYEKALALDEESPDAYLGIADLHIRRGEYDEALEVLQDALGKTGNDDMILDKIAQIEDGVYIDFNNRIRRYNVYAEGMLMHYSEVQYDENGIITRIDHCTPDGSLMAYFEYEYYGDKVGLITSYNTDGSKMGYIEATAWDENGMMTEGTSYDADGTVQGKYVSEYDEYGNMIKEEIYDENGKLLSSSVADEIGNINTVVS